MTLSEKRLAAISANLKQARKRRGFTQEEVAERAGLSTVYYCQIELSNKAPSLESLINIAEVLNVSIDSLLYGQTAASDISGITNMVRDLTPDDLNRVETVLKTIITEML